MSASKLVLGIETSCDDTSVAIIGESILSHVSFSQIECLKSWGGVVPEIAARNHLAKITPLLEEAKKQAGVSFKEISLLAVTSYPGLLGPLLTGINAAKTLSLIYQKPILPVNHLYAHLEAIHLTERISYPYLGVLLSGGHSLFVLAHSPGRFEILAGTIDDAAGEAFDKGGKLLGLGYPAGHIIDKLAQQGDAKRFEFPIGLKSSADARLSFSGTKTALRVFLEKNKELSLEKDSQDLKDICASYQKSIVDAVALKLKYALKELKQFNINQCPIVVGGGVACNSHLRACLQQKFKNVYFVSPQFCTDNGAMIANYGKIYFEDQIPFPECLEIDAKNRFINKADFLK
ncbi:MAG: tRNA (adenosine(37)-N6)-threonylcarbamoyltransferase complex transferase subunit TsaD [Halobacteriovoraceae bacterium]|nr:tRNA (adenosine(37)-N6)-threonylcarbamoyltransferase complex transferase subunit TsaD [Halobacteriovoraceae bacterium]